MPLQDYVDLADELVSFGAPIHTILGRRNTILGGLEAVVFAVADRHLCIMVDGDDDSVVLSSEIPSGPPLLPLSEGDPLSRALGSRFVWIWLLINHRGYVDGVQLEFQQPRGTAPVLFQVLAMGSQLEVRRLRRGRLKLDGGRRPRSHLR